MRLIIGNKNYSSWSLRPWLLLRHHGIEFEEIRIPLYQPASKAEIQRYSAAGQVPVLQDGAITVWDSLAICDYVAERFPQIQAWPADTAARAWARSASCEMHSGFNRIRHELSMNCRKRVVYSPISAELDAEIQRVYAIWEEGRRRFGGEGEFLCGSFGIVDAMYAPMVSRFRSYGITVGQTAQRYMLSIEALPAFQEWMQAGLQETERIGAD